MPSSSMPISIRRLQRGVSLTEALVAFVVMGSGMLAMVGMQSTLNANSDISRQRAEAVRLAEEQMERMRAYVTLSAPPPAAAGTPITKPNGLRDYGYADVLSFAAGGTARTDLVVTSGTTLTTTNITYTVTPAIVNQNTYVEAQVAVTWTSPHGTPNPATGIVGPQIVQLDSVIARVDPALATRLKMTNDIAHTSPNARHRSIPIASVDLGADGDITRSAFHPPGAPTVWLFNNTTGLITHVCTGVPTDATAAARSDAHCDEKAGLLISGAVLFSTGDIANAETPDSAPLSLDMRLDTGTGVFGATVPASAIGITTECYDAPTSATTPPQVTYFCAIFTSSSPIKWSGRLTAAPLPPEAWSFGTTPSQYRLCRYSDNYNNNIESYEKIIDAAGHTVTDYRPKIENSEHPEIYQDVNQNLINQNFLVIKGSNTCPTDHLADPAAGDFVDTNTLQQEPHAPRIS